jgi:DNA-binding transcriptional ArsR family regulator
LLVRHEPEGLSTGELVDASGLTQSTFSTHLAVLAKAGLVKSEKLGRQQIQRADIDTLRELMLFLAKDCCQGRPELCEPLLAELTCC